MTLKELQIGKSAVVDTVGGTGALRQHFLDMGLVPGAQVTLIKLAPMGDPMELRIHGYELTLRLDDAAQIGIIPTEKVPAAPALVDDKMVDHPGLGEGGKYLMNAMDSKFNVKCLGIGENGFRYLTNSKHPVKTPDDLHDLKLRIGGAPILVSTYESWGVDYTTAGWAEVYTGLQTKLYDGQENPIAVADASSIQEVQNYVTAWTANYGIMFMAINGDLYNSLSDELKAIVDECAKEACAYQIQYTREQCDSALKKWVDNYGIEVYEMTAENANLFRQKIQPVYDKFSAYNELIDLLK